jgi:hypothetical protein
VTMGPTSLSWRGLLLATGQTATYRILTLEGWEELPPARYDKTPRSNAHGAHRSKVWADERIVTVTGFCWSAADRDQLLADMQAGLVFGSGDDGEPLTVTAAGRTLTATAQLLTARHMLIKGEWGIGRFGWAVQWRCPDPLRYGPTHSLSTSLPQPGGGLDYNLYKTGMLDYGTPGDTGRITLDNPGTADAPIRFAVLGPHDVGFELSAEGRRLTYGAPVPAGQALDIDTADGTVLVEGTSSRRSNLIVADWLYVPAQDSLTVQYTSLGATADPAAVVTATWQETSW